MGFAVALNASALAAQAAHHSVRTDSLADAVSVVPGLQAAGLAE
ncbi:hypothetical protein [Nocardia puris]|nr:hypothetical protein [Nocardia puris]